MPPPTKLSLHDYAHKARLKWIDEFPGWSDDEITRGVLAKYPGDVDIVDVDPRKLFADKPNALADFHANRYGVDPTLVRRMMKQESGGNRGAVSPKGASGLMQLMPDTARSLGVKDIFDPYENVEAGVKYFKTQLDRFKDPALALAAYNAGPEAVAKHGNKVPPFAETQNYVSSILKGYSAPSQTPPRQQAQQIPQQPSQTQGAATSPPANLPVATGRGAAFARASRNPVPSRIGTLAQVPWLNTNRMMKRLSQMRPLPDAREPFRFSDAPEPSIAAFDTKDIIQQPDPLSPGEFKQQDEFEVQREARIRKQIKDEQLAGQRALVSNPNSAEARLYDPHRNVNEEVANTVVEEKQQEAENRRLLSQFTDEDWKQAQDIGDQLKRRGPGVLRGIDTAIQGRAVSLLTALAGLMRVSGGADEDIDLIRRKALAGKLALSDLETLPKPKYEQVFGELASMVSAFPEMATAVGLGGPIGGFAALEGLQAAGSNEGLAGIAKGLIKGGLSGAGFKYAGTMGSVPKELATVGATTFGTEKLFGATDVDALRAAGSNVAFSGGSHALRALPGVGLKGLDFVVDKMGDVRERRATNRAAERIASQVGIASPTSVEGLARQRMPADIELPLGREFKTQPTAVPRDLQPSQPVTLYRSGRTSGKWWSSDREYAKNWETADRPLQERTIDLAKTNLLDTRKVQPDFLKEGTSDQEIDTALNQKGYDGMIIGGEKGEPIYRFTEKTTRSVDTDPAAVSVGVPVVEPKPTHGANRRARTEAGTFAEGEAKGIPTLETPPIARPFQRTQAETPLIKTVDKTNELGNRIVHYETTTPDGKQVEVSLAIDPEGTAVPTAGVKGEGGEITDDTTSLGTKGVLDLKKQILALHPEIKQLEFNRGGSTGGKKDRFRTLGVKPVTKESLETETDPLSHVTDEQRAELRMRNLNDKQIDNMSSKDVEKALAPETVDPPIVVAAKRRKKAKINKFAKELEKAGVDPKDIDDIEFRHAGIPIDLNDIIIEGYNLIKKAKEKLDFEGWATQMRETFKGNDIESDLSKVWNQVSRFTGTVKADLPAPTGSIQEIKNRREAFDQMVAREVPDEDFKSLLSTYKTPLQKYETWKSRTARVIRADEKRYGIAPPPTLAEKAITQVKVLPGEGGKKTFKIEKPKADVQAAPTAATAPVEEEPRHTTLDVEGENRDLADDAQKRIWDIFTANTKAGKNPPTWDVIKQELNKALPRTRNLPDLLERAFKAVDVEFNPREPVPLGEPLTQTPFGPVAPAYEPPKVSPSTAETTEGVTEVRNFAKRLEERGMPFGTDILRRVHHDDEVQKSIFDRIATKGIKDTKAWVMQDTSSKEEVGDEKIGAGIALIKIFQQRGERGQADDVASFMARKLSDTGRSLRAAKFMDEISPEGILTKANKDLQNNFGKDLNKRFTADQSAQITDAATAAYSTREKLQKNSEAQGALTPEAIAEAKKKQLALKPKARLIQRSGEAAASARERIDYRKSRLRMGNETKLRASIPGPRALHPDLPELLVIGADKILKGAVSLEEFTREMVKEVGADVRPFIEQIYRGSGQDVLQRKRRERLDVRIEKVTKGKPEDFSPDQIEELLRLDSEMTRQRAKNWSELRQRAEFGYPKKGARKQVKANPEGPEKPEELALTINRLGATADGDVIIGAMKLMRATPKEWENEMRDERGIDLNDKDKVEKLYTQSYELFRAAQKEMAVQRTIRKKIDPTLTHEEQVAQAEKLLFEQKVLRDKLGKERRNLAKVYQKFTMTEEQKFRATMYDLAMIPKALKASLDLSAPGRQGWVLISGSGFKGRAVQAEALSMMVENALTKSWYESNVKKLQDHTRFDQAERSGLHMTSQDIGDHVLLTLTTREESFASKASEFIPLVVQSNRAYSGYLDAVRIGYFDIFAREMESRGVTEMKDPQAYKDLAKMINTFTGRGQLKHESWARTLNLLTWSPRFMKSRFQFLNPKWYKDLHPEARRIAMRTAVRSLGTNFALLGLASVGGAALGFTVNLFNPEDPDWLKIRHGDTRYDISGGHVPVARFMYKIAKNINNARQGNWSEVKEPWEILGDFLRTKEAPVPAFAHLLYTGKDFKGEKLTEKVQKTPFAYIAKKFNLDPNAKYPQWVETTGTLALEVFAPMVGEDFMQALEDEGFMGVLKTAPASFFGVGVSTYKDRGRFALRGFAKGELNRLNIAGPTIMGQKTGLRSFDDAVEKQLIPAIQARVEKERSNERYKKATDEQKIRIMRNLLDDVREMARNKAEAHLTKEDRRELNRIREKRYGK